MAAAFCGKCRLLRTGFWLVQQTVKRQLTEGQISTALRPFYFAVHPDLFGRFPKEQSVNEESLKKLQEYLCTVKGHRKVAPISLVFYVRDTTAKTNSAGRIQKIYIPLLAQNARETVTTVLRVSSLSLDYIDKIKPSDQPAPQTSTTYTYQSPSSWSVYESYGVPGAETFRASWKKRISYDTLNGWLHGNRSKARRLQQRFAPIVKETHRLSKELKASMGVADIKWACGWGVTNFRTCLRCLHNLHEQYSHEYNIQGHTIVFGNETGIDLWGNISLGKDDIATNWLSLLQSVTSHQDVLGTLPVLERQLSSILSDITVTRSTHQPVVMARDYQHQLTKLIDTLRKYDTANPIGIVGDCLRGLQLVIKETTGPLIASPSGRILMPASCPGFLVVDFLNTHADQARETQDTYHRTYARRQRLMETCCGQLRLHSLLADENISGDQFDSCCERLLRAHKDIQGDLEDCQVRVTHFYTVMSDGEICIPWNWKSA